MTWTERCSAKSSSHDEITLALNFPSTFHNFVGMFFELHTNATHDRRNEREPSLINPWASNSSGKFGSKLQVGLSSNLSIQESLFGVFKANVRLWVKLSLQLFARNKQRSRQVWANGKVELFVS